ncbi:MAG: T9SS type A sorting domain-containing protein [Bacteroidia bacterium]|nr:T9SS type A sorting domain-containing protein [Bacteroidia bacterium]
MKYLKLLSIIFLLAISANVSKAQTVTITQPNGGEILYACQTYTVMWTQTGSPSNYWNIDYSLDGGTIWTSVTSNYLSTNGQFIWTVPNVQSTTVLMRVRDALNSSTQDQSNAFFTINIPIILTSPNGGEIWQGNTIQNITWNAIGTSNTYTIQYSVNGGSSWTNIVTNYATVTGTYAWTIPAMPTSTNCLIKVMDQVQNCMQDVSNAVFTINAAQPILITPNGGETLSPQCSYAITWNTATFYTNVLLEYSLNNGATWTTIGTYSNTGSRNWVVPNTPSTQCLIRISNSGLPSLFDVSNATFTIATPITVTAANGGETWYGCNTYNINWNASTCIQYFTIQYSTNNGTSWNTIVSTQPNSSTYNTGNTNQTYSWLIPNGITTTQALIRVYDYYTGTTVADVSDAPFTINPNVDITVTSPNGGETWTGLTTQTITWTNLPAASGQYNILYSTNGGAAWTTITNNFVGNSYNWTVPNINNTTCRIKIVDAVNTCKEDISNANFTIAPAQPILITPNGGESLYSGTTYSITWNTATLYTNVLLEYSLNNGATWTAIGTYSNTGSRNWTVPNANSNQCLVRISNSGYPSVSDVSNAVFTIKPAVTVLTPNGDNGVTVWGGCTVTSITFDRSPAWNYYDIQYSLNNGATWTTIATNWYTTANPATYNWNIPNSPTGSALVRVTPNGTTYWDPSDAVFTITKPVTIIQPNFGGIMQVGSTYTISWSSDGISNIYDIFYSTNGGTSFTNIVTGYNTSTNTYAWTVPNAPSSNCKIWVRDNINSCKADTSDIAFTISTTAPAIALTSPNGINDTLNGCHTKTITWTDSPTIGTYDIAYSLNSGSTWVNIVTAYATATHSYDWVVPNTINSNQVLLRVRSTSTPSTFDLSDAFFTIRNGNLVATPTSVSVCSAVPVQLNATGGFNYNWTPSTGLSATNISNPVATPPSTTTYYVQSINGSCILSDTVTINITTGGTTASVAISVSPSTSICTGASVTFTATPTNGGTTPSYQWKVNGSNVGTNSTTFTSTTLNNNDVVTCVMTSNLPCVSGSPATSNTVTMTVSPNVTPSVTVSAAPGTTICSGTNVTFTTTPTNGGATPSYQWLLNGAPIGTNSSTFSNAGLTNGNTIAVVLTSSATCLTTSTATSSNTTMTVNSIPNQPGTISGTTTICAGTTNTYSIASVAGATSYTWTLPGGWTGTSTSTSISTTASTTSGTISVTANNGCGSSAAQTIAITVNQTPAQPASISGTTTICSGTSNTYSISPVADATSYTWTTPSGWTGTSSTETITATANSTSGNITVTANNACGNSTSQQVAITVNTTPATPGTISGNTTVCETSTNSYSVVSVAGATSYTWTLPAGWSGTSTSTSISTTAGTTGGTITVTANNTCGNSSAQSLVVSTNAIPAQPASITGNTIVCQNATENYSIIAGGGATSYTWTLPGGWSGTSTTPNISATAGTVGGTISVTANNTCGNSIAQLLNITMNTIPAQPGTISGNSTVCEGTNQTYSITPVANTTSYVWTYPSGWISSGTTETSNSTVGANSGTITVAAQNTCGTSATQSFAVTVNQLPPAPASISGSLTVCETAIETYSISPVSGATSYVWTVPSGWSGTSTSATISTTVGSPDGNITVAAINGCGTGATTTLAVISTTTPAQPAPISGITEICGNGSLISFATTDDVNVDDYTWTLPTGWTGSSFDFNITATNSDSSGVISVVGSNVCGTSIPQTLNFTVNPIPVVTLSSLPTVCLNSAPFTLTGGSPTGGVYSGPGINNDTIFDPASAGIGTHTIFYTYNDGTCSNSASSNIQVDMCTGIEMANNLNNTVSIYPNPFNENTTFALSTNIDLEGIIIQITDVLGREVMHFTNLNSHNLVINRNGLNAGVYLYKIINNNTPISQGKLIIE